MSEDEIQDYRNYFGTHYRLPRSVRSSFKSAAGSFKRISRRAREDYR